MTVDPAPAPVEVVVAFIEDGGHYPRAGSSNPVTAYWKAISVMVTTLRVVGVDWPVTVSTNRPPTDPSVRRRLDDLGVTYRDTPFTHRPPEGWFDRFSGSLYLLDALHDAVDRTPSSTRLMIVDPDCVWVRPPDPMLAALDADPDTILAYEITYGAGQPALGLTREEMGFLFRDVGGIPAHPPPAYAGGEFLFGSRDRLADLLPHVEAIWDESLQRFRDGSRIKANTEEHVLSYALAMVGWQGATANPFMRRLWTGPPPHRSVQGDEEDLVLWHALAEKDGGLLRLYDDLARGHGDLAEPGPQYRAHLARRLNVRPSRTRRALHWAYQQQYRRRRGRRPWPVEW